MFTRCPSCRAAFSITDQQLAIASGMVRCGVCEHVFDARLYLFKQAEEKTDAIDVQFDSDTDVRIDTEIDAVAEAEFIRADNSTIDVGTVEEDNSVATKPKEDEVVIPKIIADQVSSLEHEGVRFNFSYIFNFLLIATLIALLALQATAVHKESWLPASIHAQACRWITCVHKIPRALDKIEILNRSIYTHPQEKDALMVTVTIISRAKFAQPYPVVQLRFLDVSGDVMAARQFNPRDYLSETWNKQSIMQPSRPISIQLELVDFGEDVVGYEFDFL